MMPLSPFEVVELRRPRVRVPRCAYLLAGLLALPAWLLIFWLLALAFRLPG